jgi:lysyl-tRNA synthetase class 2
MSREQKNNWPPSASLSHLKLRARVIDEIRSFFKSRDVLEVDTPILCSHTVTDPFIASIPAQVAINQKNYLKTYYLQTSPEYAMKRLLASYPIPIFQITKSFRQGEVGHNHNPEFTMLEWYRPHFNHHQLMDEMDDLLQSTLHCQKAIRKTYADLFVDLLQINPHQAELNDLKNCARQHDIHLANDISDKDTWLDLLMSHCIEPALVGDRPFFIYDFPASQAALARIQKGEPSVAMRFEVYVQGRELANGFYELQDAHEQRLRFEKNLLKRCELGLDELSIDDYFLSALKAGLPDCAGVALGVDRLIMLIAGASHIQDILSFDFSRV